MHSESRVSPSFPPPSVASGLINNFLDKFHHFSSFSLSFIHPPTNSPPKQQIGHHCMRERNERLLLRHLRLHSASATSSFGSSLRSVEHAYVSSRVTEGRKRNFSLHCSRDEVFFSKFKNAALRISAYVVHMREKESSRAIMENGFYARAADLEKWVEALEKSEHPAILYLQPTNQPLFHSPLPVLPTHIPTTYNYLP